MKRSAVAVAIVVVVAIGVYRLGNGSLRSRPSEGGADGAPNTGHASRLGAAPAAAHAVAPDFTLEDLDGQPLDLANYRGKIVLLDFWATWCTPCRGEIPHFVALQDKYREQGLQVIGIAMDDGPKPVRQLYRDAKMNYPVALGTEELAQSYGGVLGLPILFLIGRDGRVAAKYVGEVDMPVVEQEIQFLLQDK